VGFRYSVSPGACRALRLAHDLVQNDSGLAHAAIAQVPFDIGKRAASRLICGVSALCFEAPASCQRRDAGSAGSILRTLVCLTDTQRAEFATLLRANNRSPHAYPVKEPL